MPPERWNRLAVAVWLFVILVICGRVALRPRSHNVYPIFATAARHWLAGADLYSTNEEFPYRYSPGVAALLVPLAGVPDRLGGVAWRLLNAAVYLGALAWWGRSLLPWFRIGPHQAWFFLLALPLSLGSVNNGQSNALVLGLLLATVAAAGAERWNLASLCAALACLVKVYPIAVGLLLAALYPRRFAGRFAAMLALGLALPFLLQEPGYVASQYGGWLAHLRADDRQAWALEDTYRDFRLLCRVCHFPLSAAAYAAIQLAVAASVALVCLAAQRQGWSRQRLLVLVLASGCCWMTVFGSATESCTYILLAPTLAWATLETWVGPHPRWLRAGVVLSYGLFSVTLVAGWFPHGARTLHAFGLHPLAGLLLTGCVLGHGLLQLCARFPAGQPEPVLPPVQAA
jgi:hypothetical protein